MKIKKDAEQIGSADFYYDLFNGGYFDPVRLLEDPDDIIKVNEAIYVIQEYQAALDDADMIEEM